MTFAGRALFSLMLAWAAGGPAAPELSGTGWVNSGDLDLERFRGKAVVLYFFEETCHNCRGAVPARNDLRRKYAGKPAVFIAVNSGNPKSAVEEYAKSTGFEWPILVDEDRETEERYGRKISLSNVYWFFVVAPDGTCQEFGADLGRTEAHLQALLPGARGLFDGLTVPPELRPATRRLEAGQLGEPVREIFRVLEKDDSGLGEAARRLYSRVALLGEARLKRARDRKAAGDKPGAYDVFAGVERDFPGTPMAREAQREVRLLFQEREVREELHVRGLLDQARAALSRGKAWKAQARTILEGLIRSNPQAPSSSTARRLLKRLDDPAGN